MTQLTNQHIIDAIEAVAPASLQESWDNTGLLVGEPTDPCTGALVCVDVTEAIVDEACAKGCSLIVSHHPLIFRGIKRLGGPGRVERALIKAIKAGVSVYCAHTSLDKAQVWGVSKVMASMLSLTNVEVLEPAAPGADTGLGAVGNLPSPLTPREFVGLVKQVFGVEVARCTTSALNFPAISRVALCGGSGGEFIPKAISAGAQAYINSDTRYHDFCDFDKRILLVDIGHFESEYCTTKIIYNVITEKIPNFAVQISELEFNPISYI